MVSFRVVVTGHRRGATGAHLSSLGHLLGDGFNVVGRILVLVNAVVARGRRSEVFFDLLLHTLLLLLLDVVLEDWVMYHISKEADVIQIRYSRNASSSRERPEVSGKRK